MSANRGLIINIFPLGNKGVTNPGGPGACPRLFPAPWSARGTSLKWFCPQSTQPPFPALLVSSQLVFPWILDSSPVSCESSPPGMGMWPCSKRVKASPHFIIWDQKRDPRVAPKNVTRTRGGLWGALGASLGRSSKPARSHSGVHLGAWGWWFCARFCHSPAWRTFDP